MKKTKAAGILRLSTICLAVLLSMLLFAVGAGAADIDSTAPTVSSLTLSADTVEAPGVIAVTMDATDDLSGITDASIEFVYAEADYISYWCTLERNQAWDEEAGEYVVYNDGKYHGFLILDEFTQPGDYYLKRLQIEDAAQNYLIYQYGDPDAAALLPEGADTSFTVKNSVHDTTAPTVKSLTLSAASVTAPGTIAITLDASDDLSGIPYARVEFTNTQYGRSFECYLELNSAWNDQLNDYETYDDGKYHGVIALDEYAQAGTYALSALELEDGAQNWLSYYADDEMCDTIPEKAASQSFTVKNSTLDIEAPVVYSLTLSPDSTAPSGTVAVTMDASDNLSGIDHAYVYFTNTANGCTATCNLDYNFAYDEQKEQTVEYNDNKWHGFITLGQYARPGTYVLSYLEVVDLANNLTEFIGDSAVSAAQFPEAVSKASFTVAVDHTHTYDSGKVTTHATASSDGVRTYTCTICGAVKTEVIPAGSQSSSFVDVQNQKDYFFEPVLWAVDQGITSGTSKTTFSPNQTCTRGQVVTFLWRAAGKPTVSGTNPFVDVKKGDYFYDAVLWAVSKGITNGTSKTTFSPNQTCTRGQVVTFMYRAAEISPFGDSNPFTDVKESDYFYDAVLWAVDNGITKGTSKTTFSPNQTCTRGQVVTFLYRYLG